MIVGREGYEGREVRGAEGRECKGMIRVRGLVGREGNVEGRV